MIQPRVPTWAAPLLCCALGAQSAASPSVPAGFVARPVLTETGQPTAVRAAAWTGAGFLVAIAGDLELRRPGHAAELRFRLPPGSDFAFVVRAANGRALIGELHGGAIVDLEVATGRRLARFAGPRNGFDAVPLPGGDVLVNGNPTWPQSGANAGVWLCGPGRQPRELLALSGPSAPLELLPNGDLVVAELGPIVPLPPGAGRLHRFAATAVQQAIATGGTLTVGQAAATATGWDGLYDLALDDRDRLHASDPNGGVVTCTAPGGLAPVGASLDLGGAEFGLGLAFDDRGDAPFEPFQPGERASALLVGHSDFTATFAVTRVLPVRPGLRCDVATVLPAATPANFALTGGPPLGLAALLVSATAPTAEHAALTIAGVPLWLALPTGAATALPPFPLDGSGAGTSRLTNPGGFALPLTIQAACLDTAGTEPVFATSTSVHLLLLP